MSIRFTTTAEASSNHGVKALVYGKAGVGKTTLCATAPAPLILSAEAGTLPLRRFNIPMIPIKTLNELIEAFNWVQNSSESRQFQTVYIDSLSEIAELVLINAKATVKDPRQAYGELMDKMIDTVKKFRDLPGKHVVMVAKQEAVKDEATGIVLQGPMMPGNKVGPALPYLFDEVFRLAIGQQQDGTQFRYLQTQPDMQHDAKDRSGALAPIEAPDLSAIFNKILAA